MKIYLYTTRILSKQNLSFNTIFLPCVLELKERFNPCSVDGASLCFLSLKNYFYMCHIFYFFTFTTLWGSLLNEYGIGHSSNFLQLSQFFHIYHIVGFNIELKWHWWFFKFSTTFAFFSHLPHCGVHYWMKMALVILQIVYNFCIFSHLPH